MAFTQKPLFLRFMAEKRVACAFTPCPRGCNPVINIFKNGKVITR